MKLKSPVGVKGLHYHWC